MVPAFLLWMSQNAWAASGGKCRMYSNYCRWAEAIVWTLFNCWLLLQLVLVHAATAWLDADGKPLQHFVIKRRCWLEAAPRPALMVDAPWPVHFTKLLPWTVVQTSLILQLAAAPQGQKEACSQNDNFDLYTPCTFSRVYIAHRVLAYIGLGMYMCYHLWYLRVMLDSQQNKVHGVKDEAVIFRPSPCIHCLQASTHIVMVLAATRLVVAQFAFFIPKSSSKDDPVIVQEWLQFFAWTKDTKAVKLAERASHMPQQQQRLLKGHPIFCFETAIKLLYWCGFVYEHDEGRPVLKLSQNTALKLFKLDHFQLPNPTNAFADIRVLGLVELQSMTGAVVGRPGESGLSVEQRKRLTIAV
ncbi:hypothetical protein WJX79_001453 [Trebouxia sp. C0005]